MTPLKTRLAIYKRRRLLRSYLKMAATCFALAALGVYAIGLPFTKAWFVAGSSSSASIKSGYAPVISYVTIEYEGAIRILKTLIGTHWEWYDADGDIEDTPLYQWYWVDSTGEWEPIPGANERAYELSARDHNKYIGLEITPRAKTGFRTGNPTSSTVQLGPVKMLYSIAWNTTSGGTVEKLTGQIHEDTDLYLEGEEVVLHANPKEYYNFARWVVTSGATTTEHRDHSITLKVHADTLAVAHFSIQQFILVLDASVGGSIQCISSAGLLAQGIHTVDALTTVEFIPIADNDHVFVNWTVNEVLSAQLPSVINQNYTVIANFLEVSRAADIRVDSLEILGGTVEIQLTVLDQHDNPYSVSGLVVQGAPNSAFTGKPSVIALGNGAYTVRYSINAHPNNSIDATVTVIADNASRSIGFTIPATKALSGLSTSESTVDSHNPSVVDVHKDIDNAVDQEVAHVGDVPKSVTQIETDLGEFTEPKQKDEQVDEDSYEDFNSEQSSDST